jgi:capsid protein
MLLRGGGKAALGAFILCCVSVRCHFLCLNREQVRAAAETFALLSRRPKATQKIPLSNSLVTFGLHANTAQVEIEKKLTRMQVIQRGIENNEIRDNLTFYSVIKDLIILMAEINWPIKTFLLLVNNANLYSISMEFF